ncbi:hypothetical protein HQ865_14170 [Mucilaginibacter mali]|uniref:Fatty acid desaturase n=1 Tax=Mucilaginibacter mali TaxID=2740462 RepID=A0A7D4QAJ5_9SPHI|nr:hypothetical protein [Mucilaginibacter mali]QKJ30845.1 hypothetical protein HQ865_14170 [Mucilaginibacter mali]
MNRLTTLTWQYYRLLLFHNLLFTVAATTVMGLATRRHFLILALLGKLVGFICAVAHHAYMHHNSFYFYRNAGIPIRRIYIGSFIMDMCVCALFLIIYALITHAAA